MLNNGKFLSELGIEECIEYIRERTGYYAHWEDEDVFHILSGDIRTRCTGSHDHVYLDLKKMGLITYKPSLTYMENITPTDKGTAVHMLMHL